MPGVVVPAVTVTGAEPARLAAPWYHWIRYPVAPHPELNSTWYRPGITPAIW